MKFVFMVFVLLAVAFASHEKGTNRNLLSKQGKVNSGNNGNGNARRTSTYTGNGNSYDNWQKGKLYRYNVQMRTVAAMTTREESMESKWAGVQYRAKLVLYALEQNKLRGQVRDFVYGHIHDYLSQGWEAPLPATVQYKPYAEMNKNFEVEMSGGLVKNLLVPQETTIEQENLLKAILNGLQYDTSAKNVLHEDTDFLDGNTANGVYRKMEPEVTGECEVLYSVNMLPLDVLQTYPFLAPHVQISKTNKNSRFVDIVKTRDYKNCERRVAHHFGIPEDSNWENPAGHFLGRSTVSRIIVDKHNNTVYSSYSTDQVKGSPVNDVDDVGMVMSSANMTLTNVEDGQTAPNPPQNARPCGNLIYNPGSKINSALNRPNNKQHQNNDIPKIVNKLHQGGKSDESHHQHKHRSRRSAIPNVKSFQDRLDKDDKQFEQGNKRPSKLTFNDNNPLPKGSSSSESCEDKGVNDYEPWIQLPDMKQTSETMIRRQQKNPLRKTPKVVAGLIESLAVELEQPSSMPRIDTLGKINFATKWLSAMSVEELEQTADILNPKQNKQNRRRNLAWRLYLDAVVQAGTNPAYTNIKTLILKNAIQGEQAAQLIAVMQKTLRAPIKELLVDFFNMGFDNKVKNQQYLNSTVLLASTTLINRAHVNNRTAHDYYPTHMYGRFVPKNDHSIIDNVAVPTLNRELKKAVQEKDGHKIQVYVRAIGNLGHPRILDIFEPYISKKVPVTTYQRMSMVMAMDRLAQLYPEIARYVLFNIYSNKADNYEVRVAAIFELLRAKPTLHMFQQMARGTHNDPSTQVRSAIKTAIQRAANLGTQEQKFKRLSKFAKSVKNMLSNEEFGFQFSGKYLNYYFSKTLEAGHFESLGLIGSQDSIIHKYFTLFSQLKYGGWLSSKKVQAGVSSVKQLVEILRSKFGGNVPQNGDSKANLDGVDVKKLLQIKNEVQEQLEGNLIVKLLNQERIFTLEEYQLDKLPQLIQTFVSKVEQGIENDYTKFVNKEIIEVGFPVITGMTYFLQVRAPVYIQLQSKMQGKVTYEKNRPRPEGIDVNVDLHFVLAQDYDSRVGFYCPMGEKYMSAGTLHKQQYNVPIKTKWNMNVNNKFFSLEVQPLNTQKNSLVLHRTTDTYTSVREKTSPTIPSQDKDTHFIKAALPKNKYERTYGKDAFGLAFKVKVESEQGPSKQRTWDQAVQEEIIRVLYPVIKNKKHNGAMTITYVPAESTNERLNLVINYNNYFSKSPKDEWVSSNDIVQSFPKNLRTNKNRNEPLVEASIQGIQDAESDVLTVAMRFSGKTPADYAVTIISSQNQLQEFSRMIIYYDHLTANQKTFEAFAVLTSQYPTVPTLDFKESLEYETKWTFDAVLRYGVQIENGAEIVVEGLMEQTQARREYLKRTPIAKLCEEQMRGGNYLMPACKNATIQANMMDNLKMQINYKNIGDRTKQLVSRAYAWYRHLHYYYITEDWYNLDQQQGVITLDAQLNYDLSALNAYINTPVVKIYVNNLKLNRWYRIIIARNPVIPIYKQVADIVYGSQYKPTCAIDGNMISTFANHSYNYPIGSCWNVALLNGTKGETPYTLVLVQENKGVKSIYMEYNGRNNEQFVAEYGKLGFQLNKEVVPLRVGKPYTLWNKQKQKLLVVLLKKDTLQLNVNSDNLNIVTDGKRVLMSVGETYRNTTLGLCGTNSGNKQYDLVTPQRCIMRNETLCGATWVYNPKEANCDPLTQQLMREAEGQECVPLDKRAPSIKPPGIAGEPTKTTDQTQNTGDTKKKGKNIRDSRGRCRLYYEHQAYEEDNKICITTKPLASCDPRCKLVNVQEIEVDVVCQPSTDQEFRKFLNDLDNSRPFKIDVQKYKDVFEDYYRVPQGCE